MDASKINYRVIGRIAGKLERENPDELAIEAIPIIKNHLKKRGINDLSDYIKRQPRIEDIDEEGEPCQRTISTSEAISRIINEIEKSEPSPLIESDFARWVVDDKKKSKAEKTKYGYKKLFDYIEKYSGISDFSELRDPKRAVDVINGLKRNARGGINEGTLSNYKRFLELYSLYNEYSNDQGFVNPINYNPQDKFKGEIRLDSNRKLDVYSQEEILSILDFFKNDKMSYIKYVYALLTYYGCLDTSESVMLRIFDINFETRWINLVEGTKPSRRNTWIRVEREVLDEIKDYLINGRGKPLPGYEDVLFIQKEGKSKGKPFTSDTVSDWVRESVRALGLDKNHSKINHKVVFRQSGATHRIQEGWAPSDLKEHLRHKRITTTEDRYNRLKTLLSRKGIKTGLIRFDSSPYRNVDQKNPEINPRSQNQNPCSQTKNIIKSPDSRI